MFIVIKSEHYDCTNLICKKDTLEEAVAAVKDSMAQRINKNYHTGLTGADITHENEERYRFSFDFDENRPADNSEPRVHGSYDFWKGDDEESVEWAVFEVTTDKPFFLLSYEEYESIELTGFYNTFQNGIRVICDIGIEDFLCDSFAVHINLLWFRGYLLFLVEFLTKIGGLLIYVNTIPSFLATHLHLPDEYELPFVS